MILGRDGLGAWDVFTAKVDPIGPLSYDSGMKNWTGFRPCSFLTEMHAFYYQAFLIAERYVPCKNFLY